MRSPRVHLSRWVCALLAAGPSCAADPPAAPAPTPAPIAAPAPAPVTTPVAPPVTTPISKPAAPTPATPSGGAAAPATAPPAVKPAPEPPRAGAPPSQSAPPSGAPAPAKDSLPKPAPAAPPAATPAASPRADDPAAVAGLAALAQVARFQRGDTPRSRPAALHGSFYAGVRDKDGSMIKATVERWYTAAPERLLTTRTESVTGSRSSVGFDGSRAWYRDDATGKFTVYTDAPDTFEVDLEQLHEQLRLTRLLLDAAVLDALVPRLHDVRATTREQITDSDGDAHAVQHVTARIADDLFPPPAAGLPRELELDFAIDTVTGALWALRVAAVGRSDVEPLDLKFSLHGSTASGLRVPGNIKVFRGGETRESVSLGVAEGVDGKLLFEVDPVLDPGLFAVPGS